MNWQLEYGHDVPGEVEAEVVDMGVISVHMVYDTQA